MVGILFNYFVIKLCGIVAGKDLRVINDLVNELCRFILEDNA